MSPRTYPSCPTHELQMYELAREAQHLVMVITEWRLLSRQTARHRIRERVAEEFAIGEAKHRAPTPELGLKQPHQDTPPKPRKARTSW